MPDGAGLATFVRMLLAADGAYVMEMADPGRGVWRFAALREGRLVARLHLSGSGAVWGAETNCRSCIPELREILCDQLAPV